MWRAWRWASECRQGRLLGWRCGLRVAGQACDVLRGDPGDVPAQRAIPSMALGQSAGVNERACPPAAGLAVSLLPCARRCIEYGFLPAGLYIRCVKCCAFPPCARRCIKYGFTLAGHHQ